MINLRVRSCLFGFSVLPRQAIDIFSCDLYCQQHIESMFINLHLTCFQCQKVYTTEIKQRFIRPAVYVHIVETFQTNRSN